MARHGILKEMKQRKCGLIPMAKRHLKDIAEELGVSPSQIRKWKSLDKWSDELKGNVTNDDDAEKERYHSARYNQNAAGNSGGAPPGNQNAVGNLGGAPRGNNNALVTGEYETIDFDTMSEKERVLFEGVTDDPLLTINTQIRTLKIRPAPNHGANKDSPRNG
ncbi:phage terminase small subunit-related protein [Levilactobacillus brevis]|uniref:phage terminase small subunit-related protein n=1 Tax=Levilactobacillus brevis TaxID=1580 RepID=UPI0004B4B4CF|nr:phage terminase small subunit-related protein [Levilactobacillus brevis]